jgi:hypothetical protein
VGLENGDGKDEQDRERDEFMQVPGSQSVSLCFCLSIYPSIFLKQGHGNPYHTERADKVRSRSMDVDAATDITTTHKLYTWQLPKSYNHSGMHAKKQSGYV